MNVCPSLTAAEAQDRDRVSEYVMKCTQSCLIQHQDTGLGAFKCEAYHQHSTGHPQFFTKSSGIHLEGVIVLMALSRVQNKKSVSDTQGRKASLSREVLRRP